MRARRAVDEQQQRDADADEQAGQRAEYQHAGERGHRGDEVGTRRHGVDAAGAAEVKAVQAHERGNVDEIDHCRDDDRGERRLGEVLEEPGEKEQRDDRQHGDDEPGERRARARGTVDGGLGQAAADDHPA